MSWSEGVLAALALGAWLACAAGLGVWRSVGSWDPAWHQQPGQARAGSVQASAAGLPAVVDSVRPIEAELRRFRTELQLGPPRTLEGGARSRAALVTGFMAALEQGDTAALVRASMNAAEFAYFYYPYTVYTHPPYTQPPGLVWLLTTENGNKGLGRLLQRYGGRRLDYRGYRCDRTEPQDLNRLHTGCGVLLAGDTSPAQLFGTIIERQGRFKFVSYANGL